MYDGIKSHRLSGEKNLTQNMPVFVFLTSIYLCIQFESTSQQAIMPLSDMTDLHVSGFPVGEEAYRTEMLNSQCQIKANLAQCSAGEEALQRNCSGTRGEKQSSSGIDRHAEPCKDSGTTLYMRSGTIYSYYRTNMTTSLKSPHCACVLTQFPAPRNNTDHSCFPPSL